MRKKRKHHGMTLRRRKKRKLENNQVDTIDLTLEEEQETTEIIHINNNNLNRQNSEINQINNISNDSNSPICSICFETFSERGKLNSCEHNFCLKCIKRWSNSSNVCPVCRRRYREIETINLNENQNQNQQSGVRRRRRRKKKKIKVPRRNFKASGGDQILLHGFPRSNPFMIMEFLLHGILEPPDRMRNDFFQNTIEDPIVIDDDEVIEISETTRHIRSTRSSISSRRTQNVIVID